MHAAHQTIEKAILTSRIGKMLHDKGIESLSQTLIF